ncbi:hypothetical protein OSTOST_16591, partial [Ostertagia ostertagi]
MSSENQRICNRLREDRVHGLSNNHGLSQRTLSHLHDMWVIGTNEVDSDMAAVLNLGPSFAITPKRFVESISLRINYAWRTHRGPTVLNQHETLMSLMPFKGKSIKIPPSSRDIDAKIANLEHNIQRIYRSAMSEPYHSNLTPAERKGLKKLLDAKTTLRYTVGDKCGSFVVMPQTMDKAIAVRVLSDTSVYEESTYAAFESVCRRVKSATTSIVKKHLSSEMAKRLHGMVPVVPTLYNLVKTHKIPSTADTMSLQLNE